MTHSKHAFNEHDRAAVYKAIGERRDMRHFLTTAIDEDVLMRILNATHQAPSVGLMQPWRLIRISDKSLRSKIKNIVETERINTANALDERHDEFMRLKVEGIDKCAEVLVVSLMPDREKHIFGRRTLPEMDLASAACAIQNMWLAARAEGLGMGWVSLFDPKVLAQLLNIPDSAKPIAILCLGHVDKFYPAPMLELENWRVPNSVNDILFENVWDNTPSSC